MLTLRHLLTNEKTLFFWVFTLLACNFLDAQSRKENFRRGQSSIKSNENKLSSQLDHTSKEFTDSDLGLQRPVEVKSKGFGYHLGFSSKVYHTNNAASVSSGTGRESSGIWENSLNNSFLLGAYDLGEIAFSPLFSLGYTKFRHFGEEDLDLLDFDTLSFGPNAFFQFRDGWVIRTGLGVMIDYAPNDDMEKTYEQVSPMFALGKGFQIGKASSSWELSFAYHFSKSKQIIDDLLDRYEIGFLWTANWKVNRLEYSPYLRIAHGEYVNQDRRDLMGSLGLEAAYHFNSWFSSHLFAGYSFRSSNDNIYKFKRLDLGGGLRIDAKF